MFDNNYLFPFDTGLSHLSHQSHIFARAARTPTTPTSLTSLPVRLALPLALLKKKFLFTLTL